MLLYALMPLCLYSKSTVAILEANPPYCVIAGRRERRARARRRAAARPSRRTHLEARGFRARAAQSPRST